MNEENLGDSKSTRHRSPAYPAIGLQEAVSDSKTLYDDNRRNWVHIDAAMTTLNYKPKSGSGMRVLAALIMFGLLEDDGSGTTRRVKVSDAAYRILHLDEDDPEWLALIQEAARRPKIYAEMLAEWPESLPTDSAMQKHLILSKGFNPEAVPGLVKDFRLTYDYAQLGESGKVTRQPLDIASGSSEHGQQQLGKVFEKRTTVQVGGTSSIGISASANGVVGPPSKAAPRTLAIPLGPDEQVVVHYPAVFTTEDFDFFVAQLSNFKNRITVPPPPAPSIRTGQAVWRNKDVDQPVVVVGYLGWRDGRHFIRVEGSTTGIPLDEVAYLD